MATGSAGPTFEVRVPDGALAEDLAHASQAAKAAIEPLVAQLRSGGVPAHQLKRCEDQARDGTELKGCVKLYIPPPAGRWGAVFAAEKLCSRPALVLLAVGERHPDKPWRPSVYEIAHRRLHRED